MTSRVIVYCGKSASSIDSLDLPAFAICVYPIVVWSWLVTDRDLVYRVFVQGGLSCVFVLLPGRSVLLGC